MTTNKRNQDDPLYKEWRAAVLKRDGCKCQMPGCKRRRRLQAHHIQRWADAVWLRYEVDNGITLCPSCHYQIRNNEHHFVMLFVKIIAEKKK